MPSPQKFIVYRVGSRSEADLVNRNAGSLEMIVDFVDEMYEKQMSSGDTLHQYEITYDGEFGPYEALMAGRVRGSGASGAKLIGRTGKASGSWPKVAYSFPAGAKYKAKKLKSVPMSKVAVHYMDRGFSKGTYNEFSLWAAGGKAVRDHIAKLLGVGGKLIGKPCKLTNGVPNKVPCTLEDVRTGRASLVEYVDSVL